MGHDAHDAWHRHTADEGRPQHEHAAHVNATGLGLTLLGIVFGVVFVILVLVAYFNSYTTTYKAQKLEGVPATRAEYASARSAAEQRLRETGWIDRAAGTVHLPVEDAMSRVVAEYAALGAAASSPAPVAAAADTAAGVGGDGS
jgi:hypothetical protein